MENLRAVRGSIFRGAADQVYFIPDERLTSFQILGDAAAAVQEWLDGEDVGGHAQTSASLAFASSVEFEASADDDEVEAFRKTFDQVVGPASYIRRCLNVLPDDLLRLLDQASPQAER